MNAQPNQEGTETRPRSRLAAWTHSGVNETVVEFPGVRPVLLGVAATMPFQSTPGHVENTGYYANQTLVNSLRCELGKASGQISSALKHLQKLSVPDAVCAARNYRAALTQAGPDDRTRGVSQQQVSGENAATLGEGLVCSGWLQMTSHSQTRGSTCHATHGHVSQPSSPWPPR